MQVLGLRESWLKSKSVFWRSTDGVPKPGVYHLPFFGQDLDCPSWTCMQNRGGFFMTVKIQDLKMQKLAPSVFVRSCDCYHVTVK